MSMQVDTATYRSSGSSRPTDQLTQSEPACCRQAKLWDPSSRMVPPHPPAAMGWDYQKNPTYVSAFLAEMRTRNFAAHSYSRIWYLLRWSRNFPYFKEFRYSIPYSQEPIRELYPESHDSSSYRLTIRKTKSSITLPCMGKSPGVCTLEFCD
jgi:hypothetical protein